MSRSASLTAPGSLLWFARFEARLAWRDVAAMMTAGRAGRARTLAFGFGTLLIFLHFVAYLVLHFVSNGIRPDVPAFVMVTAGILLAASAMLAQAMETVTRIFYMRSDLELILTAPVRPARLFAVRIASMALASAGMSVLVMGPFINMLAFLGGVQWLGAYGVLFAVSIATTAIAVAFTIVLFKLMGPARTRLVSQIAAAVVGGMFVIGLQVAAMLSTGTMSRFAFLMSPELLARMPEINSALWYPARAAMGDPFPLAVVLGISVALFCAITARYAPRFADYALTASSRAPIAARHKPRDATFRVHGASTALRIKERKLLLRDPWLISQSLMQLLYLIPPAVLLWNNLGRGSVASIVLVPVLIMTAGQLAGGLAWLTISGEDAPDLVMSAPVSASGLLRAKIEVVLQCVGVVLTPFAAAMALVSPRQALLVLLGSAAAAASSTAIQLWFRSQSKRSHFRRRHTSSRIATFSEAVVSITWAAAGTAALVSLWLSAFAGVIALGLLAGIRALSPRRASRAIQ
jgi:ABC-2 type transport system permease protein